VVSLPAPPCQSALPVEAVSSIRYNVVFYYCSSKWDVLQGPHHARRLQIPSRALRLMKCAQAEE
jgi:hypothetical protein